MGTKSLIALALLTVALVAGGIAYEVVKFLAFLKYILS